MGLFEAFKKKVGQKSEEINPLFEIVKNANLGIDNLQVSNEMGKVRVSGTVQNGKVVSEVEELLKGQQGVISFENALDIADVSGSNIKYMVATNSSNLNVRKGPGIDFDIIGKFPNGTTITLVRRINDTWFIVISEQLEGHCHTDYLSAN